MTTQEELVVLMTLPFGVDGSIIPGVLASSGIPVHISDRYLARQGRYVEIRVPASRLEDARRVIEDTKTVGEEMPPGASNEPEEADKLFFGEGARRKNLLAYLSLWILGPVVLLLLDRSGFFTAICLIGWSVFWAVLFYRARKAAKS